MNQELHTRIQLLYNIIEKCQEAKDIEYKLYKNDPNYEYKFTYKNKKDIGWIEEEFKRLLQIEMPHKEKQLLQSAYVEFTGPKWADGFKLANPNYVCEYRFWSALRPLKRLLKEKLSHGSKKVLPKEELNPNNRVEKLKREPYA